MNYFQNFLPTIRKHCSTLLLVVILLIHLVLVTDTIFAMTPTFDEGGHVYAGLVYLEGAHLDYYFNNPPLAKYLFGLSANLFTNPVVPEPPQATDNWYYGFENFMLANGPHYLDIINAARFVSLFFSLIGCLIIYFFAKDIIGKRVAVWAVALWAFNPMIISIAAVATPDMMAAVLFLATIFAMWEYVRHPSFLTAWFMGLAASLALATKFSNLLLYILGIPMLLGVLIYPGRRLSLRLGLKFLYHMIIVGLISVLFIGAAYQWQEMPVRLSDINFHSRLLSGETPIINFMTEKTYYNNGNIFRSGLLSIVGLIPLPIPRQMISGFDAQLGHENLGLTAYLDGQWKQGGWFYYYLYALAIKTPVYVLFFGLLTLILWIKVKKIRLPQAEELFLAAPAIFFFIILSRETGINSHSRYILPVLPFFFIWTARGLDYLTNKINKATWDITYKKQFWLIMMIILIASPLIKIHPYYLSYFNNISGGPENGWKHLIDSNIDWGQDLLSLRQWMDANPEVDTLHLAYFGTTRPDFVLDKNRFAAAIPLLTSQFDNIPWAQNFPKKSLITPGWYAVSVNLLTGMPISVYGNHGERYPVGACAYCHFQTLTPVARAGYSIYIYHLSAEDVANIYSICDHKPTWLHSYQCLAYKKTGYFQVGPVEGINLFKNGW